MAASKCRKSTGEQQLVYRQILGRSWTGVGDGISGPPRSLLTWLGYGCKPFHLTPSVPACGIRSGVEQSLRCSEGAPGPHVGELL